MIPSTGKSTLYGYRYRLVGFLYLKHPENRMRKLQMTFYHQQSNAGTYIFCISEVSRQQAKEFKSILKKNLGTIVGAEEVAPYAQRNVANASYENFQEVITETFGNKTEWWKSG